ncbi:unc-like protein [Rhizoctonia solani]|uniref:ARM repeat-containing protein n=1 Tax=Rhizoctonia solani TaxID=456999 RepID=A0A8H7H239_9AGAM|nr:unc-like protein [Rhizoctonia solani]KAF8671174.1 ARM repeat-containing protein [Rhizoctonia solani]QRW22048.1 unc-like protein [Rhizoctonia solani]
MSDLTSQLQQLTARLESSAPILSSDESKLLFNSFLPLSPTESKSLAYIALAKLCSSVRDASPASDNTSDPIMPMFTTELDHRLSSTKADSVTSALGLLYALFQVDPAAATALFSLPETVSSLEDIPEIFSDATSPVIKPFASLLAQAASNSSCRNLINERGRSWLMMQARQTRDPKLQASAAVALTKLARGIPVSSLESQVQDAQDAQDVVSTQREEQALLKLMSGLVISGPNDTKATDDASSVVDSIEGLTHLSASPEHKNDIAKNTPLLKKMFALVPVASASAKASAQLKNNFDESAMFHRDNSVLLFGIASIVSNLVSYRPPRSKEERAIEQLRRTATPGAKRNTLPVAVDDPADADSAVAARARLVIQAGVLPALSALAQSTSIGVRRATGSVYLGLVTEQTNRGKVIQGGGIKALLHIAQRATYDRPPNAPDVLTPHDLLPLQALAKLTITHPPNLLFGNSPRSAIGPLSTLLSHSDATTLQQFEALMALTNIAGVDPEGVLKPVGARRIEELMLDEHKMLRRAAVELLCNLVGSDEIWKRYTGEGEEDNQAGKAVQSRLHVLMALSDVEDLPTRRAASGALAMLTSSSSVVDSLLELERGPSRLMKVVRELVYPNDDQDSEDEGEEEPMEHDASLTLRGATIACNVLTRAPSHFKQDLVDASQETGLLGALLQTVQTGDDASKRPAAEALVWIGRAQGQIPSI